MSISIRSLTVAIVALACPAPHASAQPAGFEGVVAYKMAGKAGTEMTQMYKGTKSRTEINSGGKSTAMIMDMAAGTMTVLMPPQKAYMVMDMKKMQGLAGVFGKGQKDTGAGGGAQSALASIKATGRKRSEERRVGKEWR